MDETKQVIIIDVERTDYSVQQVLDNHSTMSVKELKEYLSKFDDEDETPIVVSHDNGYTYGALRLSNIRDAEFDEEGHEL